MIVVGLTGSIGMGKTETARLFRNLGVPVYDADRAIHDLYGKGGGAVAPIDAAFPGVVVEGAVDREKLSQRVVNDPAAFKRLERITHPLVRADQRKFLDKLAAEGAPLVVLDIPLLFEGGGDRSCDFVVVVSAPEPVQRTRVLARPGMTTAKLDAILSRQTPDAEKRARADFIVETGNGLEDAARQVRDIVGKIAPPERNEMNTNPGSVS